jgi:dehydration protein DpgD
MTANSTDSVSEPGTDGALLRTETIGHVRYVSMERPEARNALSNELKIALVGAIDDYEADGSLRSMVLSGCDCGAFSSGGDLRRVAGRLEQGLPINDPAVPDLFARLSARSKPIVAAVDGYALGGGFELALACDIRVASERSRFGLPEPRAGMLGQYGLDNLCRVIPLGEALRLQLTGGQIDGHRAYAIGLVQELAADRGGMLRAATAMAESIAACSPQAVRAIRHVVTVGRNLPAAYAEAFSQPYRDAVHASDEALEGARAFLEKRPPSWAPRNQP